MAPNWRHIGPFSDNESASPLNYFRSGRIDDLAVNPSDPNHIVAGSFFGGIWETHDVYNPPPGWTKLPNFEDNYPDGFGYGGVTAFAFRNSNELYAAN